MSHLDLSLLVIERYADRHVAHLCARYAVLDDRRRSRALYAVLNHTRSYDPPGAKAEEWIQVNPARNIRAGDVTAHVAVSPRTLARRIKKSAGNTAQVFVQKVRVEACKTLLELTNLRLSEILDQVGRTDDSTFRHLFRRHTDLLPRNGRRRFGPEGQRLPPPTAVDGPSRCPFRPRCPTRRTCPWRETRRNACSATRRRRTSR